MNKTVKVSSEHVILPAFNHVTQWDKLVVKNVNDMVGISDRDGKLLYISPSIKKILGWTPEERIGVNGIDLAHEDDIPLILSAVNKLNNKKEVTFEYRCLTKSGNYIWVENSVKLFTNPDDKKKYMIFITRDIQRRKDLEAKLAKTADALSQSNQMKDKLLSLVAHDLQNPIYSIITLTSFIKNKLKTIQPKELSDFISQINESAQNSYILLENLILWDRIQRGSLTLRPEHIKVKNLIADSLKMIEQQVNHKKLEFNTQIEDDLYIYTDFYTLDTIIKNIISNAVKYTPANGKITISAERENSDIIIKIIDSGVGMTKEQQKYLFQPDSRKRLNGLSTSHGSGLGLILCRELIAKYEGQISVESQVNKGSVFTIIFPQPHQKNPA